MTVQVFCGDFDQKLWIDGVPLHALGRLEQYWEGVFGNPDLYGDPFHLPLRPGAVAIPQVIGSRDFFVGVLTYGSEQANHNSEWRDLARMVWNPRNTLTIQRYVPYTTGPEVHECQAKYVSGLDAELLAGGRMGKMALRFTNLDGYWYDPANTILAVTDGATVTMPGDAPTRRMSMTFSGGTGLQVLTNTTTGVSMSWPEDTTTPVTVDVLAFTTDAVGGVAKVRHSGDTFWMVLDPGDNEFTLTGGGSVEINARAAYL